MIEWAEDLIYKVGKFLGACTLTKGILGIRQDVAEFIKERDGEDCDIYIYLTDDATFAIMQVLSLFAKDKNTGVLLPIPQYTLYTVLLTMYDLELVSYYLNEEDRWSTNLVEMKNQ